MALLIHRRLLVVSPKDLLEYRTHCFCPINFDQQNMGYLNQLELEYCLLLHIQFPHHGTMPSHEQVQGPLDRD